MVVTWNIKAFIEKDIENNRRERRTGYSLALLPEIERLNKQRCPYCSGWGHSGRDCPTDAKLRHLRGGVREQNAALMQARAAARKEYNMGQVTGFSLLSPKRGILDQKKKISQDPSGGWAVTEKKFAKIKRKMK